MRFKRPPKQQNYEEEEMGSPLNNNGNEVAKVRSAAATTTACMSKSGQQTSAKNQTCDRGVWSWQDERIFLQELYSIMNSYNSMNIYQGGMINIKSNDRRDVCSNDDGGGLMQNNEIDVCRVKSVERYAWFPKHQKQMCNEEGISTTENLGDCNGSSKIEQVNNNDAADKDNKTIILSGSNSDGGSGDKSTSSSGGIKPGGQNNLSKSEIDEYVDTFLF